MPNAERIEEKEREMITSIVHMKMMLYAPPIWAEALKISLTTVLVMQKIPTIQNYLRMEIFKITYKLYSSSEKSHNIISLYNGATWLHM